MPYCQMQIFDTKIFLLYAFPCILEYHNSDQFQFLLCARCKERLVYVLLAISE